MAVFSTDPILGSIVYGYGLVPGGTACLSFGSHTYDDVTEHGFARRSSQWTDVTFPEPIPGVERFGQPVFRESECIFRCPIDGSLQRNADGSPRGRNGYLPLQAHAA